MTLIHRPHYEKELIRYLTLPEIKVLKGVRRCGKSTLLLLLKEHLLQNGVSERQICYKSFEEYDVPIDADAAWLKDLLDKTLAHSDENETFYVLFDEIQTVLNWEEVVRRLYKRENTQIYITGSNAHLLSSDLATYIAGRYIEIEVAPLCFDEYRSFCHHFGWSFPDTTAQFQHYLTYGGMPGLFQFDQQNELGQKKLLSSVFDTVIVNDVALHSRVSDFELLTKLIRYVFSTSGNLFSTKKVADALSATGRKTSSETIETYLKALKDALILNECEQFGLSGKEILRPTRKFYAVDNGLRNLTEGFQSTRDIGFKLENIVYNELRRRGCIVYVGALPRGEVDFVAVQDGVRMYFQVSLSVVDDGVFRRECAPLETLADSFPKTIITLDGLRSGTTETGIRTMGVLEWLGQAGKFEI